MKVYAQRINSIKESIDSKVELKVVYEVRFMNVALDNTSFLFTCLHDAVKVSGEKDSSSLR
jgi:hypothetical protein